MGDEIAEYYCAVRGQSDGKAKAYKGEVARNLGRPLFDDLTAEEQRTNWVPDGLIPMIPWLSAVRQSKGASIQN